MKKKNHLASVQLPFYPKKQGSIRCPGWGPFSISHFPFPICHSHSWLHKRPLLQIVVLVVGGCFSEFLLDIFLFGLGSCWIKASHHCDMMCDVSVKWWKKLLDIMVSLCIITAAADQTLYHENPLSIPFLYSFHPRADGVVNCSQMVCKLIVTEYETV